MQNMLTRKTYNEEQRAQITALKNQRQASQYTCIG